MGKVKVATKHDIRARRMAQITDLDDLPSEKTYKRVGLALVHGNTAWLDGANRFKVQLSLRNDPLIRKVIDSRLATQYWPLIRMADIAERLPFEITSRELVRVCQRAGVRYKMHGRYGYILSPKNAYKLLTEMQLVANPSPVDRASFLLWMCGLDDPDPRKMPRFSVQVEKEIMRIARLPEPVRTEQAVRMVLRWRDAEVVANAILKASPEEIEKQAEFWERMRLKTKLAAKAGLITLQKRRTKQARLEATSHTRTAGSLPPVALGVPLSSSARGAGSLSRNR